MKNVSSAVQEHLQSVKEVVGNMKNPYTGNPLEIPNFSELMTAASKLDSSETPEKDMFIIRSLLGRAASVGSNFPDGKTPLNFPNDHAIHGDMGWEWYYAACHMNVTDQSGKKGRISLNTAMQKIRSVGLETQQKQGWSDKESSIGYNKCLVTVDMIDSPKEVFRRNMNYQWPLKGGNLNFSEKGEDFFYECGSDSLSGSLHVLPLNVKIDDGQNMQVDITLTNNDEIVDLESSFFLQGMPDLLGNGGSGFFGTPIPGMYYSWPQLLVKGTISVGGNTYTIDSGKGWIDHQIMMTSLQNKLNIQDVSLFAPLTLKNVISEAKEAVEMLENSYPVPFVDDATPFNGWIWQYFNLDENNQAFTGASFIKGNIGDKMKMDYGYFLEPKDRAWKAIFIMGDTELKDPQTYSSIRNNPEQSTEVIIPIERSYTHVKSLLFGKPLSGNAIPWFKEGTFNMPDGSLCSEIAADFIDTSGNFSNGVGFMESMGFQSVDDYTAFALNFLKGNIKDLITNQVEVL